MRRVLFDIGGAIGVIALIAVGIVGYAYFNLNSIIEANRARLLARLSNAIGRPVEAAGIKTSFGRGISIEVTGVKIDDDDAFSQLPFVEADEVFLKVKFIPLLYRDLEVTDLILSQPQIRIVRDEAGALNVTTIAKNHRGVGGHEKRRSGGAWFGGGLGSSSEATGAPVRGGVSIKTFTIENGRIVYVDKQSRGARATINSVNVKVDDFSLTAPFDIAIHAAVFGDSRNLQVSGTAGPIIQDGAIDVGAIAVAFNAMMGPLTLSQIRSVPDLAKAVPPALSFSDEVELKAKLSGTIDAIGFDASSDLTANRVSFAQNFDKPPGTTLIVTASGTRAGAKLNVQQAELTLANLAAKVTDISTADGKLSARVDSNKFDIGPLAGMIAVAQRYNPSGSAEIHARVGIVEKRPQIDGTVILANVNFAARRGKLPPVSAINGTIRVAGNSASLGPIDFRMGSGRARLDATVDSIQPLHAAYRLSVDKITLAEVMSSRENANGENLRQVAANGIVSKNGEALSGSIKLATGSGIVANVPFTALALDASYGGDRVEVNSLKFDAFEGSIGTAGTATIGADPSFDFNVNAQNINLQEALAAQHAKAANTIRGSLTGSVQIAGRGKGMYQVEPTLRGSGQARVDNGKLVGVNVVAQALRKIDNIPEIGALVPAVVVANHPELFKSPDTDIREASLTFQIAGPRIISHDIVVQSTDYSIFGDGWFDLDKNLDLTAKIKMSQAFSSELVGAKHNVVYLTNQNGEVVIPLRISGKLPHPAVVPDVAVIAQRAATHAVQGKLGELLQKNGVGGILKKNGLGGLLGGSW
jgi:uncharacterized protein involved in outer membrane biogenesis